MSGEQSLELRLELWAEIKQKKRRDFLASLYSTEVAEGAVGILATASSPELQMLTKVLFCLATRQIPISEVSFKAMGKGQLKFLIKHFSTGDNVLFSVGEETMNALNTLAPSYPFLLAKMFND